MREMPYIKRARRVSFDNSLNYLGTKTYSGGELNYCFTRLCHLFIEEHGESYANYAECIAALECAKLELYRRKIAAYETTKITENGDV
jgi:hypothetical protein